MRFCCTWFLLFLNNWIPFFWNKKTSCLFLSSHRGKKSFQQCKRIKTKSERFQVHSRLCIVSVWLLWRRASTASPSTGLLGVLCIIHDHNTFTILSPWTGYCGFWVSFFYHIWNKDIRLIGAFFLKYWLITYSDFTRELLWLYTHGMTGKTLLGTLGTWLWHSNRYKNHF